MTDEEIEALFRPIPEEAARQIVALGGWVLRPAPWGGAPS